VGQREMRVPSEEPLLQGEPVPSVSATSFNKICGPIRSKLRIKREGRGWKLEWFRLID
jgi:hypothetical protein